MTMFAALGMLEDEDYTRKNCETIIKNREYTAEKLKEMGFVLTDSKTNFLFAKHPDVSGEKIYLKLKERGILVRHFTKSEISEYNRITVGTKEQMDALLKEISGILEEEK